MRTEPNISGKTENAVATAYVHDAANQLREIRAGSATGALLGALVYDEAGNLVQKCEGGGVSAGAAGCTGSNNLQLQYNACNQLVQADRSDTRKYRSRFPFDGAIKIEPLKGDANAKNNSTPTLIIFADVEQMIKLV